MALMLVTEALRCFTSMLFWVYPWPEGFLVVLEPARIVYYTMSLQLFFLYLIASTFYIEKEWAKRISGFFSTTWIIRLPIILLKLCSHSESPYGRDECRNWRCQLGLL